MSENIRGLAIPSFSFGINQAFGAAFRTGPASFPGHYLLYASSGAFWLEVEAMRWLLPPQRAAWVAAHVPFQLSAERPGTTSSVLFAHGTIPAPESNCRVFAVSALAREMLSYAMRWGRDRAVPDPQADSFFASLALVCGELANSPDLFWLPRAQSPELAQAMEHTLAHLAEQLSIEDVARAAYLSERTLARRFLHETSMSWSQFRHRARMLRAMELLAAPELTVVEVVDLVGFQSVSAFSHAFRAFTGESPSSYRRSGYPT